MKVRKFIKRNRTTSGRATGTLLCRLLLPTLDERYDFRATTNKPARAVGTIRKLVNRHLTKSSSLLIGASFVIEAEIRASSGALRRLKLSEWIFGDDLTLAFENALQAFSLLELEEDWTTIDVEIEHSTI